VEQNEQQGVRVLSLKEYNRNLQLISEYTPYEVPSKDIETVFAEGMIPFSSSEQHRIRTFYDELGRPQRRIFHDELTEIYSYPVWGERVESTYAQLGKLDGTRTTSTKSTVRMSDTVHAVIDELGHPTIFERDAWLNLKGIHLPGEAQPRTLSFNSKGWLEAQNIPGLGRWVYAYGDRGEKILEERYDSQGQRLHSTVYVYDDLQRLTDEKVDGTVLMHMAYDAYPDRSRENILPGSLDKPIGLLTHVVKADPNSLYDFGKIQQYDAAGRLLGQEVRLGSEVFVETYSQTLDDIVTGITDPFGVRTQLSLGRSLRPIAAEVQAPWFDKPESLLEHLSYNSRGQLERIDYRAGTTSWMQYDPATLLPSHLESRGKDGQLLQKMSYIFDGKGQLLHIEDELVNPAFGLANRTADYRYNDRGELMTAERYGQVQSYDYNPAGNMTRNTEFSNDLMRSTARNTILPEGTESQPFTYDAAGQLISGRNILEARYDSHGQMIFARTARHSVFLGYSPDGKRSYRKTVPVDGAALPSVSFHPVASVIIESGSKQSFVSIGSHRLARLDHDRREWYYYLRDQVTSTELMLSSDGTPVEQVLYMPYGSELETTSLSPDWKAHEQTLGDKKPSRSTKHRFTGHYRDDDLGIYDFVARHYDPLLGRFLSPDPEFIARPERCSQSPIECNLYSYARNNPLRYVDPSGLATIIVHGTWSSNTEGNWANENSAFSRSIERHFGDRLFSLSWSGTNGSEARTEGAELLAQRIAEVQRLTGDKNINIVAHSHGGNVVKEYTNRPDAVRLNFVVNLNTPQRSDYRANMNNITKLINVYNHNDMVQINGGNGKIDTRIFESGNAGRFDFQAHLNIETPYGKMGKLDSHSISTTDGYWDRHIAPSIENPVPR
jgi:RHS repeat-associated protein